MEKDDKVIVVGITTFVFIVISFILLFNDIINYFIVSTTISIILFIYLIYVVFDKTDEVSTYNKKLKRILKTYDSILVYTKSDIELNDQNIIFIKKFEDLLKSQEELSKPLLYIEEEKSSAFMLVDGNEILVNIMKESEEVDSRTENRLIAFINKCKKDKEVDPKILDDLDKTTIIQLNNNKLYKVSPIRKKSE